jgi:hypothetical protein
MKSLSAVQQYFVLQRIRTKFLSVPVRWNLEDSFHSRIQRWQYRFYVKHQTTSALYHVYLCQKDLRLFLNGSKLIDQPSDILLRSKSHTARERVFFYLQPLDTFDRS